MRFRKQFILTNKQIDIFNNWNSYKIGSYNLYSQAKLDVNINSSNDFKIVLVGDAFDYRAPELSNEDILENVAIKAKTFDDVISCFDSYAGTFIVIYHHTKKNNFFIFNDNTAQKEVFFHYSKNIIALGSQPKLLSKFFDLEHDNSKEALEFYNSKEFQQKRAYIGDLTEYKDVKHLKPNHYLNVNTGKTIRFLPNKPISEQNLDYVAEKAASMLQGYLTAVSMRYKLLLPVSAGWESRILLAASKNIKHKCHYYVFKGKNYSNNHSDILVPKKLLQKLNLKLHVVDKNFCLDSDLIPIIDESISFPRYERLKHMFGYWATFYNHISIIGNVSEIARMEYPDIYNINEKKIAILQKYPNLKYAMNYYKKWIFGNKKIFNANNYRLLDMLYWEENCGNWVAKANTEASLAADYFLPFNSRELIVLLLSANKKYRSKQYSRLYLLIIKKLWPECLHYPINPSDKKKLISILQRIKIYDFYRNIRMNIVVLFKISG